MEDECHIEYPCVFDNKCGDPECIKKLYCQYQIYGQCMLCGNHVCDDHIGIEDHLLICKSCNEKDENDL